MHPRYAGLRPLYAGLDAKLSPESGNAGLWYDKYCDRWRTDWTMSSNGKELPPKLTWIEEVTNEKGVGNRKLIVESVERLYKLTEVRHGRFGIFTTESRFVTGLGRSHPVENGFAWHPTLGVPYLPGSSIKGLVRAWAHREATPPLPKEDLQRLLGSEDEPRSAGRVTFLDAIPTAPVKLEADVMTPHYAGWTPDKPPGDWREPVPVPFLVVAPETPFFLSVLPRGIEKHDLDMVFTWLRDALLGAGAGAKTAVGYGRFAFDAARTAVHRNEMEKQRLAQEQAARRAQFAGTPEGRWLLAMEGKRESAILDLVRNHLEKAPIPDVIERRAFAQAVTETPYLARWRKGEKEDKSISGGPDRLKKLARLVDATLASKDEPER